MEELRSTQRRMLRYVMGFWRNSPSKNIDDEGDELDTPPETWTEFMIRTARAIENQLDEMGIDDWVIQQKRRKYRFAKKDFFLLLRMIDGAKQL